MCEIARHYQRRTADCAFFWGSFVSRLLRTQKPSLGTGLGLQHNHPPMEQTCQFVPRIDDYHYIRAICAICKWRVKPAPTPKAVGLRRLTHHATSHRPPPTAPRLNSTPIPQLVASKTPFFAQRAPPLSSTGWPLPKKGAPKAALPEDNGTSTRPNRLTQNLKGPL